MCACVSIYTTIYIYIYDVEVPLKSSIGLFEDGQPAQIRLVSFWLNSILWTESVCLGSGA